VLSRYKTLEFRADLWILAAVAAVARAVHEAATSMLTQSDMSRIADRRARLELRKQQMVAREEAMAQEDIEHGKLTGRVVGYELGKLLEPKTIVLNDGLSDGGFVQSYTRRTQPGTYFRSGSSSGGWGSGASFGVKLARPDHDVIHATGDRYFMFGTPLPALWAAGHEVRIELAGDATVLMRTVVANSLMPVGWPPLSQALTKVVQLKIPIFV
jgi:acetolactate synthase I/II/III large subunit